MPYMDGVQLAHKLRQLNNGHEFKIVLISAEEKENILFDEI